MELIEFLERSDHRNVKFNVDYMVKQRLRELDEELEQKRQTLRYILEFENLQYDEELVLLTNKRVEETAQKRRDWIGIMKIERENAEEELIKLKKMQRELENCEEMRHWQSKQILMETKQAQRYQIEEKRALRRREKEIEQMWLEALRKLNEEKERQDVVAQKLQKVISNSNQAKNSHQEEDTRERNKSEDNALKQEHAEDNLRAWNADKQYRDNEWIHERRKKLHQGNVLQDQIHQNECKWKFEKNCDIVENNKLNEQEYRQILNELDQDNRKKIQNREWHKYYLEHSINERRTMLERDQQLDEMLIGTGCVLQQKNKKPYGKQAR